MKIYVRQNIYFYVRDSGGVAAKIPVEANLMDYARQTLYMSEQVSRFFFF